MRLDALKNVVKEEKNTRDDEVSLLIEYQRLIFYKNHYNNCVFRKMRKLIEIRRRSH